MKKKKSRSKTIYDKTYRTRDEAIKQAEQMFGSKWRNHVAIVYEPNAYMLKREHQNQPSANLTQPPVLSEGTEETNNSMPPKIEKPKTILKREVVKDHTLPEILYFRQSKRRADVWISKDIKGAILALIDDNFFSWNIILKSKYIYRYFNLRSPDDCIRYIYQLKEIPYFLGLSIYEDVTLGDLAVSLPKIEFDNAPKEINEKATKYVADTCIWGKGPTCEYNPISNWCAFCENYSYAMRQDD